MTAIAGAGFHFASAADIFRDFFGTDDPFAEFTDAFSFDPFGKKKRTCAHVLPFSRSLLIAPGGSRSSRSSRGPPRGASSGGIFVGEGLFSDMGGFGGGFDVYGSDFADAAM